LGELFSFPEKCAQSGGKGLCYFRGFIGNAQGEAFLSPLGWSRFPCGGSPEPGGPVTRGHVQRLPGRMGLRAADAADKMSARLSNLFQPLEQDILSDAA
jgi:hypothetical protein